MFLDVLITAVLAVVFMFVLTVTSSMVVRHVTVANDYKLPNNQNRFDHKL
jgi:hypothetical protein